MHADARIAIGQHLITGFSGTTLPEGFIQNIRRHKIGNVILFRDNVQDNAQLTRLCGELTCLILAETGYPPLIAIDQEGGSVVRLGDDAARFPSAMAISATGNAENARLAGRITGEELSALGVNFNLAPVLDVNSNRENPVIGTRSYGDDPERVAAFGVAMMQGLLEGGVLSAVKHFPGHGDTVTDSHLGLPVISKTLEELYETELVPFQAAIACGAPAVMTAHILFPKIEENNVPATMSRRILTGLLRQTLGFSGLIVSDCMMMDAIAKYYGTTAGTLAAFAAGVDLAILSHDASLAGEAVEAAIGMLERGEWDESEFSASTARILAAKARLGTSHPALDTVGCSAHRGAAARIVQEAVTQVCDAPFALGTRPAFLGRTRTRLSRVGNPDGAPVSFAEGMQQRLGGVCAALPQNPSSEEIGRAISAVAGCTSVTVGWFGARTASGQQALLDQILRLGVPVCVVALGSPYDLASVPPCVRTLAVYDYDTQAFDALAGALSGSLSPSGKLPVRL